MYRTLIVEDDAAAAATLCSYLERYGREAGERFAVETLSSALELLDGDHPADVIFLDIGLPGINGMEAAQIIRQTDAVTPIVFVTDLAQYAVKGYQVDAVDFMVKPVAYADFALRMGRVMRVLSRNDTASIRLATSDGFRVVPHSDIIYVEIIRHDLFWHIASCGEPLRQRGSIKAAAEELGGARFCRISASHLVNMGRVARVRSGSVLMENGDELTISRSRKAEVLEAFARYAGGSM